MALDPTLCRLDGNTTSLVIDCTKRVPILVYWGAKLESPGASDEIVTLAARQEAQASPHDEAPVSLSTELGAGYPGSAGLQVHREGRAWSTWLEIEDIKASTESVSIRSRCSGTEIVVTHTVEMHADSDVVRLETELVNDGPVTVIIDSVSRE